MMKIIGDGLFFGLALFVFMVIFWAVVAGLMFAVLFLLHHVPYPLSILAVTFVFSVFIGMIISSFQAIHKVDYS